MTVTSTGIAVQSEREANESQTNKVIIFFVMNPTIYRWSEQICKPIVGSQQSIPGWVSIYPINKLLSLPPRRNIPATAQKPPVLDEDLESAMN
jgi:hypothetical protein